MHLIEREVDGQGNKHGDLPELVLLGLFTLCLKSGLSGRPNGAHSTANNCTINPLNKKN